MQFFQLVFEPASKLPTWLVIILFGVPFIGGILFYIYKTRHARSWRKGIFPPKLKPTEDNFLEAYLALGAKLILFDYQSSKGKTQFINQYFNRYFKFSNYNFSDSLLFSLQYPIQTKTVTDWLKIHLESEGKRSQVIYFLTGLTLIHGEMSKKELRFLQQINEELELKPENVAHIIAIYASYFTNQEAENKQSSISKNSLHFYYSILGLDENATKEEIKKAYRKLAKINHPDLFTTASESQQKMAKEKFVQIKNAYEELKRGK